jgi:hypothetical protein
LDDTNGIDHGDDATYKPFVLSEEDDLIPKEVIQSYYSSRKLAFPFKKEKDFFASVLDFVKTYDYFVIHSAKAQDEASFFKRDLERQVYKVCNMCDIVAESSRSRDKLIKEAISNSDKILILITKKSLLDKSVIDYIEYTEMTSKLVRFVYMSKVPNWGFETEGAFSDFMDSISDKLRDIFRRARVKQYKSGQKWSNDDADMSNLAPDAFRDSFDASDAPEILKKHLFDLGSSFYSPGSSPRSARSDSFLSTKSDKSIDSDSQCFDRNASQKSIDDMV